ncbi:MAG: hypothetical protein NVS4B11_09980 [Ktedonobacteraceae bacterium]
MRRTSSLTMLLCGLLIALTACGSIQAGSTRSASPTVSLGENLYVLDGYTSTSTGGQRIVAFHPGTSAFTPLPAGLIAQDHQRIYTATPQSGHTKITVTSTKSGASIRSFTIPGAYSTLEQDYTKSVLSSNGRWLALKQLGDVRAKSAFVVVDTEAGKLSKNMQLQGDFDLDAVSPDGSRVYLLERLNDASGHYYVRLYRTDVNQLESAIVVDKTEIDDPKMLGSALTRQMANGGITAYTLYTDTAHNIAFVHALPLASDYIGARCIILPTGKSANLLRYYTLALSSDGSLLYAANSALGVVVAISVSDEQAFSDKIQATAHFTPDNTYGNANQQSAFHSAAVLSSDNTTLYFAGVRGIRSVDTHSLTTKATYAAKQAFTSIALSGDGKTLYAVHPTNGILMVNTDSGQTQQVAQSPAHSPWGIEWVSKG